MFGWKSKPKLSSAQNSPFRAGERWSYRTRPNESDSTFVVLRVETMPDSQNVVHLRLEGLRIPNTLAPSGLTEVAGHLPVAESSVSQSAKEKIGEGETIDLEGYAQWKSEWEKGRAGIFTLSLAEIADFLEEAMKGAPPS